MSSARVTVELAWEPLGTVSRARGGILAFPEAPAAPGLYRFRIHSRDGVRSYIGESVDLERRLGQYRIPGRAQTNTRLNMLLLERIAMGDRVEVETCAQATLVIDGATVPADLADRHVRRLVEGAAIVSQHQADEGESLNR